MDYFHQHLKIIPPSNIIPMITACLQVSPQCRPTIQQVEQVLSATYDHLIWLDPNRIPLKPHPWDVTTMSLNVQIGMDFKTAQVLDYMSKAISSTTYYTVREPGIQEQIPPCSWSPTATTTSPDATTTTTTPTTSSAPSSSSNRKKQCILKYIEIN